MKTHPCGWFVFLFDLRTTTRSVGLCVRAELRRSLTSLLWHNLNPRRRLTSLTSPHPNTVGFSFPGGREHEIIVIYFFAFGNIWIYKTLILFNWKYCHLLVGMLHNVSRYFPFLCVCVWFGGEHRSVAVRCTEAPCPPGASSSRPPPPPPLVLVVFSGNDTRMHVSHSADSPSMDLHTCSSEHRRI